MNKSIILTMFTCATLLSIGVSYAVTPISDEATITTADSTTSPTLELAQTGAIAWHNKLEANSGDYIIGIEGGQNALEFTRSGTGISQGTVSTNMILQKNTAVFSVQTPDASTSPVLRFGQVGATGWQYTLEDGTGDLRVSIEGGQDAVEFTRNGLGVFSTTFPNGNVGIGTTPNEKLDVNGNIRLTGNIVSPNDICIGNCP